MKKTLLTFVLVITTAFVFAQESTMTFNTLKNIGETVQVYIVPATSGSNIWIDLNNDNIQDSGEEVTDFAAFLNYPIASQTITIHGAIREIYLFNNKMTSLNTSNNSALVDLRCSNNNLEMLEMSGNNQLSALRCYNNNLENLDLSNNIKIVELFCYGNKLSTLDLSGMLYLNTLSCYGNELTSILLPTSQYSSLQRIGCFSNKIAGANSLALVNSLPMIPSTVEARLIIFDSKASPADQNVIEASHVQIAKNKNWLVLDYNGGTSTAYEGVDNVSVMNNTGLKNNVWAKHGVIYVSDMYNGENIKIFTLDGKIIYSGVVNSGVVTNNFHSGVYIVSIDNQSTKILVD